MLLACRRSAKGIEHRDFGAHSVLGGRKGIDFWPHGIDPAAKVLKNGLFDMKSIALLLLSGPFRVRIEVSKGPGHGIRTRN